MAMLSPSDLLHTDSLLDHGSNHKTADFCCVYLVKLEPPVLGMHRVSIVVMYGTRRDHCLHENIANEQECDYTLHGPLKLSLPSLPSQNNASR